MLFQSRSFKGVSLFILNTVVVNVFLILNTVVIKKKDLFYFECRTKKCAMTTDTAWSPVGQLEMDFPKMKTKEKSSTKGLLPI